MIHRTPSKKKKPSPKSFRQVKLRNLIKHMRLQISRIIFYLVVINLLDHKEMLYVVNEDFKDQEKKTLAIRLKS